MGLLMQQNASLQTVSSHDHVVVARRDPGSPGCRTAPGVPSCTRIGLWADSRSAKSRVNMGGMCWTITIGTGKFPAVG